MIKGGWKTEVFVERRSVYSKLHGVTSKKTVILMVNAGFSSAAHITVQRKRAFYGTFWRTHQEQRMGNREIGVVKNYVMKGGGAFPLISYA